MNIMKQVNGRPSPSPADRVGVSVQHIQCIQMASMRPQIWKPTRARARIVLAQCHAHAAVACVESLGIWIMFSACWPPYTRSVLHGGVRGRGGGGQEAAGEGGGRRRVLANGSGLASRVERDGDRAQGITFVGRKVAHENYQQISWAVLQGPTES